MPSPSNGLVICTEETKFKNKTRQKLGQSNTWRYELQKATKWEGDVVSWPTEKTNDFREGSVTVGYSNEK